MSTDPPKRRKPRSRTEDPSYYEALGRAVKVARTELGLERKELAERAGVSYAYLSDIESGRGRPSSQALRAIAQALGLAPSELLAAAEARSTQRFSMALEEPADEWVLYQRASARAPAPASAPGASNTDPARAIRMELHSLIDRLPEDTLASLLSLIRSFTSQGRTVPPK